MTVAEARARFFARNGLSERAYTERWARVKIGRIPIVFPNVRSRRRAIRFHDIHHVATGYDTTLRGEAQLGAWEIAATWRERGKRAYWAAWLLNSMIALVGLVLAPRRVARAFARGRRCTSVYGIGYEAALAMELDELRGRLGLS